jgi:hypothetical protein
MLSLILLSLMLELELERLETGEADEHEVGISSGLGQRTLEDTLGDE